MACAVTWLAPEALLKVSWKVATAVTPNGPTLVSADTTMSPLRMRACGLRYRSGEGLRALAITVRSRSLTDTTAWSLVSSCVAASPPSAAAMTASLLPCALPLGAAPRSGAARARDVMTTVATTSAASRIRPRQQPRTSPACSARDRRRAIICSRSYARLRCDETAFARRQPQRAPTPERRVAPCEHELTVAHPPLGQVVVVSREALSGLAGEQHARAALVPVADVQDLPPGGGEHPGGEVGARPGASGHHGVDAAANGDVGRVEQRVQHPPHRQRMPQGQTVQPTAEPAAHAADGAAEGRDRGLEGVSRHLVPGGEAVEHRLVACFPPFHEHGHRPACEVGGIHKERVLEVEAGGDAPGVATERAESVLGESAHERLVHSGVAPVGSHPAGARHQPQPHRLGELDRAADGTEESGHRNRRW